MCVGCVVVIFWLPRAQCFLQHTHSHIPNKQTNQQNRSALTALHRKKRGRQQDPLHHREAERLLLRAIGRDDRYLPAYLSLASLYIYRMKQPQRALDLLRRITVEDVVTTLQQQQQQPQHQNNDHHQVDQEKDYGRPGTLSHTMQPWEALLLDARALAEGGNERMLTTGALVAEQEYLAMLPPTTNNHVQNPNGWLPIRPSPPSTTTATKIKVS